MADKPDKPEQIAPPKLTITDSALAPYVFFDGAPSFGYLNGIVNVTLVAGRHLLKDGVPTADFVAVAYLRCMRLSNSATQRPISAA